MIKAFIFDFDGLLVDTETTEYLSFYELGKQVGVDLQIELWHTWVGSVGGRERAITYLSQQLGDTSPARLVQLEQQFNHIFDANIINQPLLPGVKEILAEAKQHHLKLAIASSSDFAWVSHFLRKFDLLSWFDHVQTRDNVQRVKPDPEIYLKALQGLGIASHEAIAFEDSFVGSCAAKAAGITCIVIPNMVTKTLDFSHVDQIVNSLNDVDVKRCLDMYHEAK
jgi:putative hydrolase of the HAD superfamily